MSVDEETCTDCGTAPIHPIARRSKWLPSYCGHCLRKNGHGYALHVTLDVERLRSTLLSAGFSETRIDSLIADCQVE